MEERKKKGGWRRGRRRKRKEDGDILVTSIHKSEGSNFNMMITFIVIIITLLKYIL